MISGVQEHLFAKTVSQTVLNLCAPKQSRNFAMLFISALHVET